MILDRIPRRLVWLLALILLIGTASGFASFLKIAPVETPSRTETETNASTLPSAITCLGYVDGEKGVTSLAPERFGRVAEIVVHEGDAVRAGAILLRLDDRSARLARQQAQAALDAAKIRLAQAQEASRQHPGRLAQQKALLDAAHARLAAARCLLTRKQELVKSRLGDAWEIDAAREQVHEMEALCQVEQEKRAELRRHDAELAVRAAQAETDSVRTQLQESENALEQCVLKAPEDGTVLRILVGRGTMLNAAASQAAILFRPAGPLVVRAEVEQEFASQLAVGQPALVEDEFQVKTRWRGRVQRIADWYTQRRQLSQQPPPFRDVATVECVIALDSVSPPPRLGQRVRVTIGETEP